MYDYLEGRVAERALARLVLDVGGVGYDLSVPLGAAFPEPGGEARVWTHLVVREDSQRLYGFADRAARDLFRALLTVRGVGPGVALSILSGLDREALVAALAAGDSKPLQRIKGVGRKTAEQILLDLEGRAGDLLAGDGVLTPAPRPGGPAEDAVAALVSLGFSEKEARRNVERAQERGDADDLEQLVRRALSP